MVADIKNLSAWKDTWHYFVISVSNVFMFIFGWDIMDITVHLPIVENLEMVVGLVSKLVSVFVGVITFLWVYTKWKINMLDIEDKEVKKIKKNIK